eukprot:Protomagalhaensia_sp_Gyna_25__5328@NODE_670_length_2867_cov_769_537836_g524_i0_p1_GENE_NODE_670_length_2867_cov_769_537836_g524_i0NODE_670_length_2867_cov_769_537836_g524_i0_p1_ORF_typecomplete_len516_score77_91Thioredoxin/PF00085_20/2_4e15Thioredoxin/PF00085_20/6_4e03Thioredoxin/PF00085_20/4_3e02Thioredoxin_6/PF13848_6/15Thioredoxin_6/PF13848_6/4_4e05Calsequestrin/PF01216_17/1_9e03Calsequestrin/PF01216_17/0_002Thioredoxin_7/PF13899_6/0_011Thioredoxin_7/PF13899_6/6_1e03Thioredoxin_2/PF13098_6/0_
MRKSLFLAGALASGAAGSPIVSLTSNGEWRQLVNSLKAREFLLLDYYVPWCGHCQRLESQLEIAAKVLEVWNSNDTQVDKSLAYNSRFLTAKVDCTAAKKACTEYAVYSYPTLQVIMEYAKIVSEFPAGPRTAEHLLAFVATNSKPRKTLPLSSDAELPDLLEYYFKRCRVSDNTDFDHFACIGQQANNLLIGMKAGLKKMLDASPDLARTHLLAELTEFGTPLSSPSDVCWVDTWRPNTVDCITTEGKTNRELKQFNQRYLGPLFVKDGTWGQFFATRNRALKSAMVVALDKSNEQLAIHEQVFNQFATERRSDVQLLYIDAADDHIMKLFRQLEVDTSTLPVVGLFTVDPEDRGYFTLRNSSYNVEELQTWWQKIKAGEIKPSYPGRHEPGWWPQIRRHLKIVGTHLVRTWQQQSMRTRALLIAAFVTFIVGSLSACWFTVDDGGVGPARREGGHREEEAETRAPSDSELPPPEAATTAAGAPEAGPRRRREAAPDTETGDGTAKDTPKPHAS